MKKLQIKINSFNVRQTFYAVVLSCLFFGSLLPVHGQSLVTFAQFLEKSGSQDFIFTNNATNAAFGTINGGSPIDFRYSNITDLNPALQGFQDAHLYMVSATNQPASKNGSIVTQAYNGSINTIQIIRDTPAPVGAGDRRNLLTITFSPNSSAPSIAGADRGNSASFSATTPDHTVTFSSDFLSFSNSTQRNLALSFSSLLADLRIDTGGFLKSFTAAGSGTFAANPPPIVLGPTAAAVAVSGRVTTPEGRGLRNAQIILTEADGSTHVALTGNFGQYRFAEVASGQSVLLSVRSKRYRFSPQIFSLTDDLDEVNFTAHP